MLVRENDKEKTEERLLDKKFSRRKFLKGSAAAAAVAGVAATNPEKTVMKALATGSEEAADSSGDQIFTGACRGNCMGGCPLEVTVRNGKVVKTAAAKVPNPEYRRICQRGLTHAQSIYNEKRLKYPMRRVGERGAGEWERISWEEAIKEISTKWKGYRDEFGEKSIAFSNGSGNYGLAFGVYVHIGYLSKLRNVLNATNIYLTYDNAGIAATSMVGYESQIPPHHLLKSKTIVVWGANPTEATVQNYHFISEAKKNGAKLVVIDPNYTTTASKADVWVPIRPGTDGALALAMTNIALDEGYADWNIIKNASTAPFLFKESDQKFLKLSDIRPLGENETDEEVVVDEQGNFGRASEIKDPQLSGTFEINGEKVTTVYDGIKERMAKWTPKAAAEVCGIPETTIYDLLKLFTENKPTCTYTGYGLDHYVNGNMAYISLALLSAVTGNINMLGGGITNGFQGTISFFTNPAPCMPTGVSTSPTFVFPALPDVMDTGKYAGEDLPVKSLYISFHNAVANQTDRKAVLDAFNKIEFIVASDIYMNDTTRYADIILPCAHWFEQDDVSMVYSPYLTLQEKAIDPLYESKDNYEIIQLLAKGMGFGDLFTETREEFMKAILYSPILEQFGMNYDRLVKEKVIYLPYDPAYIKSANGRLNFYFGDDTYPNSRYAFYDNGQEVDWDKVKLPYWEPPHEAWTETIGEYIKSDLSEKYPLIYTTYRNKVRCHTQFGYNPWLLELFPEPTVMVNSVETEKRGINDGDLVKIFNERGHVVVKVVVNNGIHPGMVVLPKGWQEDQFVEGHYSDLTSRYMEPNIANNYFFDALCEMEVYKGGKK